MQASIACRDPGLGTPERFAARAASGGCRHCRGRRRVVVSRSLKRRVGNVVQAEINDEEETQRTMAD